MRSSRRTCWSAAVVTPPRKLERNQKVVVVVTDLGGRNVCVVNARVRWTARGKIGVYRTNTPIGIDDVPTRGSVRRRDEGIDWALGWTGKDADALRAQIALERSTT